MCSIRLETSGISHRKRNYSLPDHPLSGAKVSRIRPAAVRKKTRSFSSWSFRRKSLIFIEVVLAIWILKGQVWGAGFTLYNQGTAAMAQGNAFVAEANDPSAIFYNPAGLNQLKRPAIYLGGFLNYPDREFHGPAGEFSQTNHRFFRSGSVYLAFPFNAHVAAGLGFYAPFGLGSQWPPTWEGRYITTFSSLKTYNLNAVISIRPVERFSIAVGVNSLWSTVELKRKIPVVVGPLRLPDGESRLKGDGQDFGINVGTLWELVKGVKWGLSYRTSIAVNLNGNLDLTLPSLVPGPRHIPGSAKLTFPPLLTTGISVSRFPPFTFNFDVTWTGWSTYDQLKVNLSRPILVNGVPATVMGQPKNWQDTWTFRFGLNYQLTPTIKLRGGYIYDQSPVPDDTFDPQIPNANQHFFCIGGDWKIKQFTLGIAYSFVFGENRNKNNAITLNGVPFSSQANGRYNTTAHLLGLSLAYQF